MKAPIILASLFIIISQASFASQPESGARPDMAALATQLQLDTNQAQQLEKIMHDHHQKMQQLRQKTEQERETRHVLRQQHREELLTILDYQQLYQLETYMQQFRPRGKSQPKSDAF